MKRVSLKLKCDIFFAIGLFLKLFSAGFDYFLTLDDYIQYGGYPLYENVSHVFLNIGTIKNRPLASLLDPLFWGEFFPDMWVALLILGVVYFFSAKLFTFVLEKCNIYITPFFYAVYLFLPLTFEGTYWLSASTRVVVGLFMTALSAYFLVSYIRGKKAQRLLLYILFSICSFGFYESVAVFSGVFQGILILHFAFSERKPKRLYLLGVPFVSALMYLAYLKIAGHLITAQNRMSEFSFYNFGGRVRELFSQLFNILTEGLYKTTITGFKDGVLVMLNEGAYGIILALLIVLVSLLCAYFGKKQMLKTPNFVFCIILGFFTSLVPLIPHVLVPDVWLTLRSMVTVIIGLLIMISPLLAFLLKNEKVRAGVIFAIVLVFLTGSVNELYTYKKVYEKDRKIAREIGAHLDKEVLDGKKETIVLMGKEVYTPQNYYFKDHVKSALYTDWSATGLVRAEKRNIKIKMITPVYSLKGIDTEGKLVLYMNENYKVTEVKND